ncbi:hypothetical protein ACHAPU_007219 [Fusarium lateritium]
MEGIPGHRLLHELIDEIAILDEDRIFASIPVSEDAADEFKDITYGQLAVAIDRTAWWLLEVMGGRPPLETFAYLGRNDLRYQLLIVAAIKTHYKILLPSLRNSSSVQELLMNKTNCRIVIYDAANRNIKSSFETMDGLELVPVPDLTMLLNGRSDIKPYPKIVESHAEALQRPFMILHSSGSTGNPKPIVYTLQSVMTEDMHRDLDQTNGKLWYHELEDTKCYVCMPAFHSAGVWFQLILPVYHGMQVIWGPADVPLNPDIAARVITPAALFALLDFVFSAGSPLAIPVGDSIADLTRLHNFIGYSEATAPPRYLLESTEWKYHQFHPASGFQAEPIHDGSELHELVIKRLPYKLQSVFLIFPGLEEYRTKDLISKHTTKPHLWLHRGRLDDLILLSTGEKVDPHATEVLLQTSKHISSALVYGNARTHCALLIELQPEVGPVTAVDFIWPLVQEANKLIPGHAQISQDMILIANTSKPFARAGKGSIQRQMTFTAYDKELEALYDEPSDDSRSQTIEAAGNGPDTNSLANIMFATSGVTLKPEENMFTAGIDSRHAVSFLKTVTQLWFPKRSSTAVGDLGVRILYNNPTLDRLSATLRSLLGNNTTYGLVTPPTPSELEVDVNAIIENLSLNMAPATNTCRAGTILLTGSTGSLGSVILNRLLASPLVGVVYCLVRSKDKAIAKFKDMGLSPSIKLQVLQGDLSDPGLGLHHVHYQDIAQTVDTIIHCAWNVNFNHTIDVYIDTDITGVLSLIDLSVRSRQGARIIFTSSIAAVANWDTTMGPVPERIIHGRTVVSPSGYGQSKYIAEHLLNNAAKRHGIPVTIIRVGQIAGSLSDNGTVWNKHEWFPVLLQASKDIGALPRELGAANVVDWIPRDVLADTMVEISTTSHRGTAWSAEAEVVHAVNPNAVPWSDLTSSVLDNINSIVDLLPYNVWVSQLKNLGQQLGESEEAYQWLSLLEWFQDFEMQKYPALAVGRSMQRSHVLGDMEPISTVAMQKWIGELCL